jgi:hypothetical protein
VVVAKLYLFLRNAPTWGALVAFDLNSGNCAGGHGKLKSKMGDSVIAFAREQLVP